MNRVTVHPFEIDGRRVIFRWSVEPRSLLYRQTTFFLDFPAPIELERIPPALWTTIAVLCLHPHWMFLRPCAVELPVRLPRGGREFWLRLLAAQIATLDAYRDGQKEEGGVDILEGGGPAEEPFPDFDRGRCATAFSGGKDSLLQAGLLSELTQDPVLVTTTSPMPPMQDHLTPRRRYLLSEISRRRKVTLVEVRSDFRSIWRNDYSRILGYHAAVNEVTDTFLYFGSLLAAGFALGAVHLFLASEAEVQESAEVGGQIIQHPHCMYSAAIQRSIQAYLRPWNIRYGSMTSPLHTGQVQQLLWNRYPDLGQLQYSCWRVTGTEAACNRCSQCLRVAFNALQQGQAPESMGIDLTVLLPAMRGWTPRDRTRNGHPLPKDVSSGRIDSDIVGYIQRTPEIAVRRSVARTGPLFHLRRRGREARRAFLELRARFADLPAVSERGYRPKFLDLVDPLLRGRVGSIYSAAFPAEPEVSYEATLARSNRLVEWITEPLGGEIE